MTYQRPGQQGWQDLAGGARLYVMRGTTLNFKLKGPFAVQAVPGQVTVRFDAVGAQTATATCGAESVTANVTVYELTATATFDVTFDGRSTTDIGVCERVSLGVTFNPNTVDAGLAGGLKWRIDGAVGPQSNGTLQTSANNKSSPGNDGKAYYLAPSQTAGFLKFSGASLTPDNNLLTKVVTLELVVQYGPSDGMKITKAFTVHTPQAEMMDVRHKYQHEHGMPSAGFKGDIYLRPANVSFNNIEWREAGGKAKAYANDAPGVPGGYFIFAHDIVHHPTGATASAGEYKSEVRKVGADGGSYARGCWVMQVDSVWSGYNDQYPFYYTDTKHSGIDTDVPSTMSWLILWQYKPKDGSWITFQKAEHKAVMDAAGAVTISKAGASKTFNKDDADARF